YGAGDIKCGIDGKIYWSIGYYDGVNFNYPYPDSVRNMYNENLSVINQPNNLGTACNFQPYSFYLGGKRTYYGLPNNPNYDMQAWGGSVCDTLGLPNEVSNFPASLHDGLLTVYYHSGWQTAFINASNLNGNNYSLVVYNLMGQKVFHESGSLSGSYFTKDLNCNALAKGMYV